jgi:hypothetical protein
MYGIQLLNTIKDHDPGSGEIMVRKFKISIIIVILLIFVMLGAGCIHIDFGGPFRPAEEKPAEYQYIQKADFPISHEFDYGEQIDPEVSKTLPINVKKGTKWVNITIDVEINDYSLNNDTPIANDSLFERYVHVIIDDPNGEEYYNNKFLETNEDRRHLATPITGPWVVRVEARGFGYGDTKDSFSINAMANEPI